MAQWEEHVKAEIDYTGSTTWNDYSVYTGKTGYALLYFETGKMLNSPGYIEQAFFMAEKCTMHLHKPNAKDLTFLTGVGGPLALAAACSHSLKQPEKEHHFVHRYTLTSFHDYSCFSPQSKQLISTKFNSLCCCRIQIADIVPYLWSSYQLQRWPAGWAPIWTSWLSVFVIIHETALPRESRWWFDCKHR